MTVAALGKSRRSFRFADDSRPPAGIGGDQPRWPVSQPQYASHPPSYPASPYPESAARQPGYGGSTGPISLSAPGVAADDGEIELPPNASPSQMTPRYGSSGGRLEAYPQNDRYAWPQPDRA